MTFFVVFVSGKVRVPWNTACADQTLPYAKLSGMEKFTDKEETSHIEIPLAQGPQSIPAHSFAVILNTPKSATTKLNENNKCLITVENDIGKNHHNKISLTTLHFIL